MSLNIHQLSVAGNSKLNLRWKILRKKTTATNPDLSYHCSLNNTISQLFTYIYIVLGMLNNLELIQCKQEIDYMQIYCIIYANYM